MEASSSRQPVSADDRPALEPLQPDTIGDIYRGANIPEEPSFHPHIVDHPPAPSSISSASSSSTWHGARGAIAAVVELAISRWARSSSSSSSSSTSSSSTISSVSRRRRRSASRRRASVSTVHITPAQRAQAREALEHSRRVPREFTLLLPTSLCPVPPNTQERTAPQRTLRTSSLPVVLAQLENALKKSAKLRRDKHARAARAAAPPHIPTPNNTPEPPNIPLPMVTVTEATPPTEVVELPKVSRDKGKQRQPLRESLGMAGTLAAAGFAVGQKAWWLDVACPSWEDMRAIGNLLHLHPLTLEDILHQDPREKLEIFPRLGYYLVVFRAIDPKFRPPVGGGRDAAEVAQENIHVINVYLTVFREGICSFHFADISAHANRVRDKILQLEETVSMSSDLIAHGLMDSIVDAFMPLMREIEVEVEHVDALVSGISYGPRNIAPQSVVIAPNQSDVGTDTGSGSGREKAEDAPTSTTSTMDEKAPSTRSANASSRLHGCQSRILAAFKRSRLIKRFWRRNKPRAPAKPPTLDVLLRMTSTRRVVTSLTRLLVPKNEVIGQLRKRLMLADLDVHLGDVHDHIVTMQQSLAYYERILSHSHPAYLSVLGVSLSAAKSGHDKGILYLSAITVVAICMQFVTGIFSMNCNPPHNRIPSPDDPPGTPIGKFNMFGIVLAIAISVAVGVVLLIRWWRRHAKRKSVRQL